MKYCKNELSIFAAYDAPYLCDISFPQPYFVTRTQVNFWPNSWSPVIFREKLLQRDLQSIGQVELTRCTVALSIINVLNNRCSVPIGWIEINAVDWSFIIRWPRNEILNFFACISRIGSCRAAITQNLHLARPWKIFLNQSRPSDTDNMHFLVRCHFSTLFL